MTEQQSITEPTETPTPPPAGDEISPPENEPAAPDEVDEVDEPELNARDRRSLRRANEEAKKYRLESRERQYQIDELRAQLFEARTAAAGVLIDPADLPFDPDIVDDPDAIAQAARDLVAERPYLARNRTTSNIGQHEHASSTPAFSLAGAIRDAVNGR